MYIFVMRHGEAINSLYNDKQRPLTELGISESKKASVWLRNFEATHHIEINNALVSPFLRAQQTFDKVNTLLSVENIAVSSDIVPTGDCHLAHDYINARYQDQQNTSALLIVSHMPFVSYLIDALCGAHFSRIFSTGSLVCIDYDLSASQGKVIADFNP
ncbi:phosphohistidine phosphatase SixA [Aliiglaciecola litoralis]|uniref:Phosphohistidine phosphatase SixA n=1 Tax=Aliiglaciecola litoralis TaxID=582857 RepID=A0ABN1LDG7_9ALTE